MLQLLGVLFLMIVCPILSGSVFTLLWGWFIVPTFGLPALTVVQAIGISLVVSFFKTSTTTKKDDQRGFGEAIGIWIVSLALSLFLGWIVHLFM